MTRFPKSLRSNTLFSVIAFAVLLIACGLPAANAAERIYTIDTSQSSITISGSVTALISNPQQPDDPPTPVGPLAVDVQTLGSESLTTSYSGTIRADRGINSIQFLGGSSIDANLLPDVWQPAVGGGVGSAPADYAGAVLGGAALFAGRDFLGDLLSAGTLTVNAWQFDLSSTLLQFIGGSIDFNAAAFGLAGGESIVGNSAFLSGNGSLSVVGSTETLTIPINAPLVVDLDGQGTANLLLTGQLVATAMVPEPSAIGLGIISALGGAGLMWRRRQARKA